MKRKYIDHVFLDVVMLLRKRIPKPDRVHFMGVNVKKFCRRDMIRIMHMIQDNAYAMGKQHQQMDDIKEMIDDRLKEIRRGK